MNGAPANEMILANAGSGKTHRLVSRMAGLLLRGFPPQSLAALTFTRKAAGEFQEKLFVRLARACLDQKCLADLRNDTGLPALEQRECAGTLRALAEEAGRLTMGTIDSLCLRIARCFPFECGLPGGVEIAGEHEQEAVRIAALEEVLEQGTEESFEEFLELVREQSHQSAGREVFDELLRSSAGLLELLAAAPPGTPWGDHKVIWPHGSEVFQAPELSKACDAFRQAVLETHPELLREAREALEEALGEISSLTAGSAWSAEAARFFESKLVSTPKSDHLQFTRNKSGWVELNDRVATARRALALAMMRQEIEVCLRRSRALQEFIRRMHEKCEAAARRNGRLSFAQITARLAAKSGTPEWTSAVGCRLDSRFDHWLLDEFQDTSRQQWRVLQPFVDEVVQDDSGRRSLFTVGDTKQALYAWRGGDARLFFEILDYYNRGPTRRILEIPLATSQRSSPVILEVVNQLFGNHEVVARAFGLEESAAGQWRRAWHTHEPAPRLQSLPGFFLWESFEKSPDEDDPLQRAAVEFLKRWRPWERGIECACLTAKNDQAAELAAVLESRGVPVNLEGKSNPCTDNPAGQSLMLALRVAAAPSDRLSATLLAGFPLGRMLLAEGEGIFRKNTLASLAAHGFEATVRSWVEMLHLAPGGFAARRTSKFLELCADFDRSRTPADGIFQFLDFLAAQSQAAPETGGAVRLMTVHQSKGLTFDATIVLGLDSRGSNTRELALGPDPRNPQWGLLLPRAKVCENEEVLARLQEQIENERRLGEVCKAYVALTRARCATVLLTNRLGKNSTARNVARLLHEVTGGDRLESGNPNWFEGFERRALPVRRPADTPHAPLAPPIHRTPAPTRPSPSQINAAKSRAREFGREIHATLATIEWLENFPPPLPDNLSAEARQRLLAFFSKPENQSPFRRSPQALRVYRELPFELMMGGEWVSGVIDRLVIEKFDNEELAAIIYEFKTGEISEEDFRAQTQAYEKAVKNILGISKCKILKFKI